MENATIIIIDDDLSILKLTKVILEKKGYKVETFSNGADAIVRMSDYCPSLVLLDLGMPEMDGFQVFEKLKGSTTTAAVPVIMFTAHGRDREIMKAKKLGLNDYIVKPFIPGNLINSIKKILGE